MLYFLGELIESLIWMKSIYFRGIFGFLVAFCMVLWSGKPFINYLKSKKLGESIREEGPKSHFSKKGTPTMGGVLIVISVLLSTLITGDVTNKFIVVLLICMLLFGSIGFIDDYKKFTESKKGLSGKKKIMGQILISLVAWGFVNFAGITGDRGIDLALINPITSTPIMFLGGFLMLLFIIVILVGTSNAVNITDGLDGLVIMPVIIAAAVLAVLAYFTGHTTLASHLNLYYIEGAGEITVFLSSLVGGGLGFLWYNFYPAQIFMGDTGSLTLGGVLGLVAIFLKQELLLPIVGMVFVIEAMSVIVQVGSYKMRRKRVFKMAPIHHHFELEGLPETKVTMRFWILALFCGMLAVGIVRLRGIF